jgi:DSF synthase
VLWGYFNPRGAPSFTPRLLSDIRKHDRLLENNGGKLFHENQLKRVDYYVAASRLPGVYNLGGDLAHFMRCIEAQDREQLMQYATLCIDNIYPRTQNYFAPEMVTISLVQGDALGGGFETALASNVVIMEEHAKMGFPEILFNMFPGMGAYSVLARRVGSKIAEDMILSGNMYSAEQLHKMGLVDMVVPQGHGELAVYDYIQKVHKRRKGVMATYQARNAVFPITREELMKVVSIWVDVAMRLEEKDLRVMARIVRSQQRLTQTRDLPPAASITGERIEAAS